jgi:ribosomal protein S18 acetylase RimI-like enzyme
MNIQIRHASLDDLESILALQKSAYRSEAMLYDDFSIQPLTQTLDELQDEFVTHTFLIALIGKKIVGTVRAVQKGPTCFIGKLAVNPDFQDQGIGSKLMAEIESLFPNAERFELFTGHKSTKSIYLYEKLGYVIFDTKFLHAGLTLLLMEKKVT